MCAADINIFAGDTVTLCRAASAQFAGSPPVRMRVIRVLAGDDRTGWEGWVRVRGYILGPNGEAVGEPRDVYFCAARANHVANPAAAAARRNAPDRPQGRTPTNRSAARVIPAAPVRGPRNGPARADRPV